MKTEAVEMPLKDTYQENPQAALLTLSARATLDGEGLSCQVETTEGAAEVGLYPKAGGNEHMRCSGDMLLQALAACAGVTLRTVARELGVAIRGGAVIAEGDLDVRGTLGVAPEAPVGFRAIRVRFELDTDATALGELLQLTEQRCVIYQTLCNKPTLVVSHRLPVASGIGAS